jgi:AraC-like DNA-binding protein
LAAKDPHALPSIANAARALGISARTLTRRLGSELTSYPALLIKRRRSAAEELSELPEMTVPEVAEALGYADPCAFHKAFKRWTSLTPMQYVKSR